MTRRLRAAPDTTVRCTVCRGQLDPAGTAGTGTTWHAGCQCRTCTRPLTYAQVDAGATTHPHCRTVRSATA